MTIPSPQPSTDEYSTIEIEDLRLGTTLVAAILDDRDVLLLAEGQTVTETFLQKLRDRKVRSVRVHDRDIARLHAGNVDRASIGRPQGTATDALPERDGHICPLRNEASDRFDAEVSLGRTGLPAQGEPLSASLRKTVGAYDPTIRERMIESYSRSTQRMSRVYDRLAAGLGVDRPTMEEVAADAVTSLTADADQFAGIGANVPGGDYPSRHSVHVSHLALAIGVRLGLDLPTVRELVLGCLVHDAGMLLVDRDVYDGPQVLGPIAFLKIAKHPIFVFDMLKDVGAIPTRSAFVAYQIHERCDGSGYPRRRSGTQIHFLSKVAAVADTYVALVSPRPHRPAMMPYHAMERVVRDAGRGLFDRDAVRALLRTLSLFPIGSYVELNDGRRGRVLRAGDDYTRPSVELSDPAGSSAGSVLDLAAEPSLSVARALPSLAPAA